jgi:hypothetical protein
MVLLDEILQSKKNNKTKHDWNKFFGKVQWNVNPVVFQRNLRDE